MNAVPELFLKAVKNRLDFLAPHRERFNALEEGSPGRAELISELLKIEPSHIHEDWIINELEYWLRHYECMDYIDLALKAQKKMDGEKRNRKTERESHQYIKDFFLYFEIERIMKHENVSTRKACTILANRQAEKANPIYPSFTEDNSGDGIDSYIRKRYGIFKKKINAHQLPMPYFGKDVTISDDGHIVVHGDSTSRPGARIELPTKDGKPMTFVGKWTWKTPFTVKVNVEPEKT